MFSPFYFLRGSSVGSILPPGVADIVFVLSGGSSNNDPDQSLGGDPSSTQILGGLENLFSDVTEEQSAAGLTDYRCFYVFNNADSGTLRDVKIWSVGSGISLGLNVYTEVQRIVVVGTVTGGYLDVIYDEDTVRWHWDSSLSEWALNLQEVLNTISDLSDVTVSASQFGGTKTFQVTFGGSDSGRFQPLLAHDGIGTLFGSTSVTMSKLQSGGPINVLADSIDVPTTTPFGVSFFTATASSPIAVGSLRPLDGFPVWVRRVVGAGTPATADATFSVRLKGSPI